MGAMKLFTLFLIDFELIIKGILSQYLDIFSSTIYAYFSYIIWSSLSSLSYGAAISTDITIKTTNIPTLANKRSVIM